MKVTISMLQNVAKIEKWVENESERIRKIYDEIFGHYRESYFDYISEDGVVCEYNNARCGCCTDIVTYTIPFEYFFLSDDEVRECVTTEKENQELLKETTRLEKERKEAEREKQKQLAIEKAEREEYERLKTKFGKE